MTSLNIKVDSKSYFILYSPTCLALMKQTEGAKKLTVCCFESSMMEIAHSSNT